MSYIPFRFLRHSILKVLSNQSINQLTLFHHSDDAT